jgi:hypothetical protein
MAQFSANTHSALGGMGATPPGQTKYEAMTLEVGVTHNNE